MLIRIEAHACVYAYNVTFIHIYIHIPVYPVVNLLVHACKRTGARGRYGDICMEIYVHLLVCVFVHMCIFLYIINIKNKYIYFDCILRERERATNHAAEQCSTKKHLVMPL